MRRDIQFLRGIAVLVVVLYHAGFTPTRNGFLGVDVFFVISGFLITTIILRGLDAATFSFTDFYLRRARRLLPALYCTLIFTTLLACHLLTQRQLGEYIHQLVGSITFSANMVLPFQVGYFEDAAETRPLLHIWSLSLEEQYYFLLPVLLLVVPSKNRRLFLWLAAIASFALCFFMVTHSLEYFGLSNQVTAGLAFFLFPTRAWELLAGSLLAWTMLRSPSLSIPPNLKRCALLVLIIVFGFTLDSVHPRTDALIAVIATTVMIVGRDDWLPENRLVHVVEKIGDWSYSLYLVHWPLFAFANIVYLGTVPTSISVLLVTVSLILAYMQFQYVEQRFRNGVLTAKVANLSFLVIASLVLLATPLFVFNANSPDHPQADGVNKDFRRGGWGLSSVCNQQDTFDLATPCRTSSQPRVAVWGDSFAMALVPGLLKDPKFSKSLVQLTKTNCAPIVSIAPISEKYSLPWASGCTRFNDGALEYINDSESIELVILSSRFKDYFEKPSARFLHNGNIVHHSEALATDQLMLTIALLKATGKKVLIVTPPPIPGFNIGECLTRQQRDLVILGRPNCNFTLAEASSFQKGVRSQLSLIQKSSPVELYSIDNIICDVNTCNSTIEGTYMYRDDAHLSVPGSELAVPKLGMSRHLGAEPS